jgi:hypothetical protein
MTINWAHGTYMIAATDGRITWTGSVSDDGVWGIGPAHRWDGPDTTVYQLTHRPTGQAAGPAFTSEARARAFAEELAPLAAWETLTAAPEELRPAFTKLVRRHERADRKEHKAVREVAR